jgi:hypothetical protein
MALLAPSIMSTTSTYLQLEELQKRPTTFHHGLYTESISDFTNDTISESEPPSSRSEVSRQSVLLLKGAREQYSLVNDHAIPSVLHQGEILVKV